MPRTTASAALRKAAAEGEEATDKFKLNFLHIAAQQNPLSQYSPYRPCDLGFFCSALFSTR